MCKWLITNQKHEHMSNPEGITCPWSANGTWFFVVLQDENRAGNV